MLAQFKPIVKDFNNIWHPGDEVWPKMVGYFTWRGRSKVDGPRCNANRPKESGRKCFIKASRRLRRF